MQLYLGDFPYCFSSSEIMWRNQESEGQEKNLAPCSLAWLEPLPLSSPSPWCQLVGGGVRRLVPALPLSTCLTPGYWDLREEPPQLT